MPPDCRRRFSDSWNTRRNFSGYTILRLHHISLCLKSPQDFISFTFFSTQEEMSLQIFFCSSYLEVFCRTFPNDQFGLIKSFIDFLIDDICFAAFNNVLMVWSLWPTVDLKDLPRKFLSLMHSSDELLNNRHACNRIIFPCLKQWFHIIAIYRAFVWKKYKCHEP